MPSKALSQVCNNWSTLKHIRSAWSRPIVPCIRITTPRMVIFRLGSLVDHMDKKPLTVGTTQLNLPKGKDRSLKPLDRLLWLRTQYPVAVWRSEPACHIEIKTKLTWLWTLLCQINATSPSPLSPLTSVDWALLSKTIIIRERFKELVQEEHLLNLPIYKCLREWKDVLQVRLKSSNKAKTSTFHKFSTSNSKSSLPTSSDPSKITIIKANLLKALRNSQTVSSERPLREIDPKTQHQPSK